MKTFIGTLLTTLTVTGCASGNQYPLSDHYDGERFYNAVEVPDVSFWRLMKHIVTGRSTPWPDFVANDPDLKISHAPTADRVAVTFVNHATVLIQWNRLNILTDPVWSERVGPWNWAGPKRVREPGVPFESLPRIDLVVISHNHFDHLDLPTLRRLNSRDQPEIYVPLGDRALLESEGFSRVREMDWWNSAVISDQIELTFTPGRHNSGRGLFDTRASLWGGYMIRLGGRYSVYFAGDTAYSDHFQSIHARLGPPDLALLPIGAYEPRATMRMYHLDPADAVRAQLDLRAPRAVGIHFGTFQLTNESIDQPLHDLTVALDAAGLPKESFIYLKEGRTAFFEAPESTAAAKDLPRER